MNAPAISFFERLYLPPSKAYTLEEIIILIRSRRWEYLIVAYRAALSAGDREGAREQKKQLPGFTPSGLFKGGHRANQLEAYSQIAGLDFDHVANPSGLAARLRGLATTLALFVSPGGQGLKVFVAVDTGGGEHPATFAAVAACYEQLAGLFCDRACKDISRCCYVSYDPEAYYNPEAEVFSPSTIAPAQVFVHDWLRNHPALEGNRNQTVYRLGCEANRRGFGGDETATFCAALLTAPDFTEEKIRLALSSAYQGNSDERSSRLPALRPEAALTASPVVSGEELRESTPLLPADLTDHLPSLLGEAIRFYTDPRERDMVLLAGTPGQFPRLIPDTENGLVSRLLLYTCRSKAVWQDVSPTEDTEDFESHLDRLSERMADAAELLRKRRLQVRLTARQWEELNRHFGRLLGESDVFGSDDFLSVVKRYGLITFRLCMIFTVLDVAGLDYGVDERFCSDRHFRTAMAITGVCIEHSRLLMTQLQVDTETPELSCPDNFRKIFNSLPEQFTLSDLYPLCQSAGIGERAVRRYLSRLQPAFITRLSRGVYRKTEGMP